MTSNTKTVDVSVMGSFIRRTDMNRRIKAVPTELIACDSSESLGWKESWANLSVSLDESICHVNCCENVANGLAISNSRQTGLEYPQSAPSPPPRRESRQFAQMNKTFALRIFWRH